MYTLEGSSIFWKFLTTLMMRSVTSLLSRNDPFASSEDIHRRPHRASCSAAAGLRAAADDGAAAKRRCLRIRLLAAAIRGVCACFSLGRGSEAARLRCTCGGGGERRRWLLRLRSEGGVVHSQVRLEDERARRVLGPYVWMGLFILGLAL